MNINYEKKTIEMTKSESKGAGVPNSEKFNELIRLRSIFPDFSIVIKSVARKTDAYKGLDYDFMIKYIKKHENSDDILTEFYQLRGCDKDGVRNVTIKEHSYGEIKMWFLDQFPEIEKFNAETDNKLKEIKAKRSKARIAA